MKSKKKTIALIDVMIQHADKGPSGFWTDDYEGCGNPKIFPEFEEGLKHGKYVHKDHYLCPWNTAILYGDGHGNIRTGCYHSCSIRDARYLSTGMLATVLTRFKERLQAGDLDDTGHIEPLLTEADISYIEEQKAIEKKRQERQWQKKKEARIKKASALIQKYQDDEKIKELLTEFYGEDIMVTYRSGNIDFSPAGKEGIVGGKKLSYDDYLDIQIRSAGKQRSWFEMCYYNMTDIFKGCVERKTKDKICFEKIYVSGMYIDGLDGFDGREDHVWMDLKGFEDLKVGDCVSFCAEVYRYIKTGNGKILDYGLRDPEDIEKIGSYELPSDKDITMQAIDQIICETCYFSKHCNGLYCLRDQDEIKAMREMMYRFAEQTGSNE